MHRQSAMADISFALHGQSGQGGTVLHLAAGPEALDLATRLLQSLPAPRAWEAADVQWSWRRDQRTDPRASAFVLDDAGRPVAGALLTDWASTVGLLVAGEPQDELWEHLGALLADEHRAVDIEVDPEDTYRQDHLTRLGFTATEDAYMTCFLPAAARNPSRALAEGFTIVDRTDATTPHPMVGRNGEHIAERLAECPLWDPALDLAVVAADGTVAGYGLFWADPVTGTGLVEPMRTEDAFQGRGLGAALLSEGLERLARTCDTLKVTYEQDNPASQTIYLAAGFQPTLPTTTWVRAPR